MTAGAARADNGAVAIGAAGGDVNTQINNITNVEHPGPLGDNLMLNLSEHRKLRNILMAASAPTSLRAIYREAAQGLPGLPRYPEFPDDMMSSVDALRAAVSAKPLFEFLVRLASGFDEFVHTRLWGWIRATAPEYGIRLGDLEELDDELRRTYFVVRLEPDLLGSGFQVTVWRFAGTTGSQVMAAEEPWSLAQVAEVLGRLVEEFDGDPDVALPIVEFFLPLELLDHDLDTLPVWVSGVEREIGTVCPVVVRPLDRIGHESWQQAWHDGWGALDICGHQYDPAAICWVDEPSAVPLDSAMLTGHVCLALAYDRTIRLHEDHTLQSVLSSGIPVVLWHRTRNGRRTRRQALEQVLTAWALKYLPERVYHQRVAASEAGAEADHAGRDLVLMWDDPNRVPLDLQWQPPRLEGTAS